MHSVTDMHQWLIICVHGFFFRKKFLQAEEILVLFVNYKLCISDVFACYFFAIIWNCICLYDSNQLIAVELCYLFVVISILDDALLSIIDC